MCADYRPFEKWDAEEPLDGWTPQRSYRGILSSLMAPAPHSAHEHNVIIVDESGEYA